MAPDNPVASPVRIAEFINAKQKDHELDKWHVAIMSSRAKNNDYDFSDSVKIWQFDRSEEKSSSNEEIYYITKSHIISPSHEFIDLTEEELEIAKHKTLLQKLKFDPTAKMPNYPNGNLVRNDLEISNARFPLLLIYLLNPKNVGLPDIDVPIVGYAIRFPGSKTNTTVTYAVHEQLLAKFEVNEAPEDYEYED